MEKKKGLSLQTILTIAGLALIYLLAFLLDRIPGVPIMLTTVLRKGAIYSLVAVSMNLLNGFTGLFSLGQAGFMLVGAYTFAAINISSGIRSTVYQYYDPLLNFSLTETLQGALGNTAGTVLGVFISLLLAGLLAAVLAYLIGLPVLKLKSDYLAIATLGFADRDSERMLAGLRGEIPAEARLARLWVDGPVPGDVMCPLGMSGRSKKVSDLLNEARIPVSERAGVPVVRTAPGGAVVWVAGVRADERFKCTAATRVAYLLRVVDAE